MPERKSRNEPGQADFLIITAHEDEREAVLRHLPAARRLAREGEEPHTYYEATVASRNSEAVRFRVLITQLLHQAPAAGAVKAQAATSRWSPRYVLMVGAAAGLEGRAELGDVLVASELVERPADTKGTSADAVLLDVARNLGEDWRSRAKRPCPEARTPRRLIGRVLSGGDEVELAGHLEAGPARGEPLLGVEVAGGGVALGLHFTQSRPRFLLVRGVGSLVGRPLEPGLARAWRDRACDAAAAYALALVEDGPVPARPTDIRWKRALALVLLAGAVGLTSYRVWPHTRSTAPEREPIAVVSPKPPGDVAPLSAEPLKPPGDMTPGIAGPAKSAEARGGAPALAPSATPRTQGTPPPAGCATTDVSVGNGEFEAVCYCGGTEQKRSSAFEPKLRDFTLKREKWSCL